MKGIKPWQLVLIGLAALALVGGLYLAFFSGPRLSTPNSLTLVDVMTGDRFIFDTAGRAAVVVPERHPDTGELTLVPLREEDGRWYAVRLRAVSEIYEGELPAVINLSTGEVRVSETSPRRVKR